MIWPRKSRGASWSPPTTASLVAAALDANRRVIDAADGVTNSAERHRRCMEVMIHRLERQEAKHRWRRLGRALASLAERTEHIKA